MIFSLLAVLLLVVAVAALTHASSKPVAAAPQTYGSDSSFLDNFSLNTYRPMVRLASQMDRKFVTAAHSGTLADCYRKIQRSLLREYLREASRDFNRLYAIANAKCVQAASDPGDLSVSLLEQQMTFIMLIWSIEARLAVDRIIPFGVNLQPVVESLAALARQTRDLARPQLSYQAL